MTSSGTSVPLWTFTASITALHTAFEEHVVENPELVQLIDAAYRETLESFR